MGDGGRRGRECKRGQGRRAGDKTYWPGAEPAVEAGCRASLHGPKGADGQREGEEETEINSVRTGFIPPGPQNWAGPRRESEEEGSGGGGVAIYIILFWTKEDICEHKRELFERLSMWKYRTGPFELINQSIKGCCL